MPYYKNCSYTTKTFYGVKFRPGEVHQVPGFINNIYFIQVSAPLELPKVVDSSEDMSEQKPKRKKKKKQEEVPAPLEEEIIYEASEEQLEQIIKEEEPNGTAIWYKEETI